MSKYFWFGFSARFNDGSSLGTKWMDERFSNTVTLEDREFLSCDALHVVLQTPYGSICHRDDLDSGRYSFYDAARLVRDGADESALTIDDPIPWHRLSDYGAPDECVWVESGGVVSGVSLRWIEKWRDTYWVVNSGRDGKLRRTRCSFRDIEGRMHYFYVVPWFLGETPQ